MMSPFIRRYGSYTSSNVPESSPIDAANVSSPTGPPENFWISVRSRVLSLLSRPSLSTSRYQGKVRHISCDRAVIFYLGKVAALSLRGGLPVSEFLWIFWRSQTRPPHRSQRRELSRSALRSHRVPPAYKIPAAGSRRNGHGAGLSKVLPSSLRPPA